MKLKIRTFGDPVLRCRAEPVAAVTDALRRLADDMLETMYAARGLGLAAQQVGETCALCVIDIPAAMDVDEEGGPRLNPDIALPLVLFNPEIRAESAEKVACDEGCLSFPEIHAPVRRAREVTVRFLDREGQSREVTVRGLMARAVQHEGDHLAGVLLVDRMSPVKKISLAGQLKRLKKETLETLGG